MTAPDARPHGQDDRTVISIDAMGGDAGPAAVVAGVARFARNAPGARFMLHGPEKTLSRLVARRRSLRDRVEIRDATGVVKMDDKPSHAVRHGTGTSMWSALDAVRAGDASVAVSCGNTGALMALSMMLLRKMPGVNRPAIAVLWPSRNPQGHNVMLDVGADIRADEDDLLRFALMGASYARNGLGRERPRIGLLNVGTEDHKGRPELKAAQELVARAAEDGRFEFVGFVEGSDITGDACDVIVTDGFTGNVAIKTGEGTAQLIGEFLRGAFRATILSRFASILAMAAMRRFRKRIDPRRMNGGVLLGLNGTVVKSHGSADATSVAAALKLASRLAISGFSERIRARVASGAALAQGGPNSGEHREMETE